MAKLLVLWLYLINMVIISLSKARMFLLVDLWEIFLTFRVGGTKKIKKQTANDQFTGHFQSFFLSLFIIF